MIANRAPIILTGQVYYDEKSNTYLVVTNKIGEMIRYTGQPFFGNTGYRGSMEDVDFIERFAPVDVADLQPSEVDEMLSFCEPGTVLKTGYIKEY